MEQEHDSDSGLAAPAIGPATRDEIDGVIELLNARPPSFWMWKVSGEKLRTFLGYAAADPRSVLLLARPKGESVPAGYVFAILDAKSFWTGFALRHPVITLSIVIHSLRRRADRRRDLQKRVPPGDGRGSLPEFRWSPSHPAFARIVGLYVRSEHRRKGIAMKLYFELFAALKEKGGVRVEEYMGPDYPQFAGKFPEACGWVLQKCRCEGYKITKTLERDSRPP